MIRNRLAEILSERSLSKTKVAEATGLSRNTINSTASNASKMIQYETLEKLCVVLQITPNDFFECIPVILDFSIVYCDFGFNTNHDGLVLGNVDDVEFKEMYYYFEMAMDITGQVENESLRKILSEDDRYYITGRTNRVDLEQNKLVLDIAIKDDTDDECYELLKKEIPTDFHLSIREEVQNVIETNFAKKIERWVQKRLDYNDGYAIFYNELKARILSFDFELQYDKYKRF